MTGAFRIAAALAALVFTLGAAAPQAYRPPEHRAPPPLFANASETEVALRADSGMQIERNRSPAEELADTRKLTAALAAIAPQRRGTVDAYVIAIALDSDPVFGREARVAGDVLKRRFDADGRTIVLAGSNGTAPSDLPRGTPGSLALALARIAEVMDKGEDVVVLYSTSHGAPWGLFYHDGDAGYGAISPYRLWSMLNELGIQNRLLMLSACYSGIFVPLLQSDTTAIVTAASAQKPSFGCMAENDWTFFGDALINRALRKPQPLAAAAAEAQSLIAGWESGARLDPSQPQVNIGSGVARWLGPLEARMPRAATQPVGRPSIESLQRLIEAQRRGGG